MLLRLGVLIIMKSVLSALNLNILFVIQPEISLSQSSRCVGGRSVSAVDKDIYAWVASACKLWPKLLLRITELCGVVHKVNRSGPRTEPWGTLLPLKNGFIFCY